MNETILSRILAYFSAIPSALSQAFNPDLGDDEQSISADRPRTDQSASWGWQMYGNW